MKKVLFFIPILLIADVDPFNINTNNPNFLTPTEKAILKNKKDIQKLKKEISNIKTEDAKHFTKYDIKLEELENRASSFNTLVDNLSLIGSKVNKLSKEVKNNALVNKDLLKRVSNLESRVNKLESEIKDIKSQLVKLSKIQNDNFNTLKKSIDVLLKELQRKATPKKKSIKEIFQEAKKAFEKGDYKTAKKLFTYTYNRGYYKATSAFYLGEIAYLGKQYKKALAFYKESVKIYPKKTSFTDRLLYHTGRSFMKTGNKKLAKITFEKLIHDFPNSIYTKFAKKDLEKLN